MKDWCHKIGVSVIILGFLGSVILAVVAGRTLDISSYSYNVSYTRNWTSTIVYFVGGLVSTVLSSTIFFALSEMLARLEILENNAIEKDESNNIKSEPSLDEWKCAKCGRINPNYTGMCACGNDKY